MLLDAFVQVPLELPARAVGRLDEPQARCRLPAPGPRVGDRDGDELGEVVEPVLAVGREWRSRVVEATTAPQVSSPSNTGAATDPRMSTARITIGSSPPCPS